MKKLVIVVMFATLLIFAFAAVAPAASTLAGIQKKGELVVGTTGTQPPLNATSKTGAVIGFDADLARFIATSMGVSIKFAKMPFAELLPPPVQTDEQGDAPFMRAVVFVTEYSLKGTERSGQEYVSPLLVLTGEEYSQISFGDLYARICDALRGNRTPIVAEVLLPDGQKKIIRGKQK